jgi:hypothetical protein
MPIGNVGNIDLLSDRLSSLAGESVALSKKLRGLSAQIEQFRDDGVALTGAQLAGRVGTMDVGRVQAAFDSAKALYLSSDIVDPPTQ